MAYTLHCEKATLDFDLARGSDATHVIENGKAPRIMKSKGGDGYSQEIDYFLSCVRARKAPTTVTARDGLTALEICEAEEKSVRTGAVAEL